MSSHSYSVSGQRSASLQLNGGHVTGMTCPSRTSDAVTFDASGLSKIEITLGDKVRIEKRHVKRGDVEGDFLVLVIGDGQHNVASVSVYGYPAGDTDNPGPENTRVDVRSMPERFGALAYYEEVEVVGEINVADLFANSEGDTPEE